MSRDNFFSFNIKYKYKYIISYNINNNFISSKKIK